jgi:type I restriction enzyme S subunit
MKFEKLKNIVEVKKGKKPSFVETPDENSVRVLQIDDLRNDNNPKFTNDKTGVLAKEDDVLIAWDGANAGTIGYGKSGYIGSTIALLRKKQPDLYSSTFIGIFLQSQYQYLRSKSTGATIPHISRKALDDLEVPVISVNDQLHIANILSKAENLIAQRKESIRLLDEFLKSTFLEMFGSLKYPKFDTDEIEKYSLKITDGTHLGPKFISSGVPFLLVSNIINNEINYNTKKYISEEEYFELNKRTPIEIGDILITSVGSYGNPALVKTITKFAFQRHIAYIKPDTEKINNVYLFGALKSAFVKVQIERVVRGAAQKTLNLAELRKLKIPIPPLELQTKFAQIVEKTEALKTQYQQSLKELENLYGSLSQRAFKGELTIH